MWYAGFEHARAIRVPKVMEAALHSDAIARGFPCLLPAANGLCRVCLVGAGLEVITSGAVTLRREHVFSRLPVREVAGPELEDGCGARVEGNHASRAGVRLAFPHREGAGAEVYLLPLEQANLGIPHVRARLGKN